MSTVENIRNRRDRKPMAHQDKPYRSGTINPIMQFVKYLVPAMFQIRRSPDMNKMGSGNLFSR